MKNGGGARHEMIAPTTPSPSRVNKSFQMEKAPSQKSNVLDFYVNESLNLPKARRNILHTSMEAGKISSSNHPAGLK